MMLSIVSSLTLSALVHKRAAEKKEHNAAVKASHKK